MFGKPVENPVARCWSNVEKLCVVNAVIFLERPFETLLSFSFFLWKIMVQDGCGKVVKGRENWHLLR